ncbi:MAG: diphosphomevalonate decarboxylase [Thermoproteota archaeon]
MKATAKAHPIQGLIKYHGLKDPVLRIPFHDSISVCADALSTVTTVETGDELKEDLVIVNGEKITGNAKGRVETVLQKLRKMADYSGFFKIVSENSLTEGKGLGFSASGFAALGLAASAALKLDLDDVSLCEVVRLGAGSATRSLVGGFAIWYADKNGRSYAEQIAEPEDVDLTMVIIPIQSSFKTDEAHFEVLSSPLFESRLKSVSSMVESMKRAIVENDVYNIGRLAEEDTLNLHAITMTGKSRIVLWEPETIRIIKEVMKMRSEGIPAWYSIDTGPSVFINTFREHTDSVVKRMQELKLPKLIVSRVGDKASLVCNHLF